MQTDDLIAQMSGQVTKAGRHAAIRRLGVALALGAAIAFVLMLMMLGPRPDFAAASRTAPFWIKWAFTLSVVAASLAAARRLGDPSGRVGAVWWLLAAPFLAVAALAGLEMGLTAPAARPGLMLGHTAWRCAAAIALLSVPVFLSLRAALRHLAPTRLRLTGAVAGLLSAAAAASVYAFACPEASAAFMMSWYSAGFLASGVMGALVGPRLLRW
jgi:hypothetical protein